MGPCSCGRVEIPKADGACTSRVCEEMQLASNRQYARLLKEFEVLQNYAAQLEDGDWPFEWVVASKLKEENRRLLAEFGCVCDKHAASVDHINKLEECIGRLLKLEDLDRGDMSLFFTEQPCHPITAAYDLLSDTEDEEWRR